MTHPAKKLGTIHLILAASLSAIFVGCAASAGETQADEHAAIAPAAPAAQTESCIPRYDDPTSCLPKPTAPGPGSGSGEACYPAASGSYGSTKYCVDVSQCVTQEPGFSLWQYCGLCDGVWECWEDPTCTGGNCKTVGKQTP